MQSELRQSLADTTSSLQAVTSKLLQVKQQLTDSQKGLEEPKRKAQGNVMTSKLSAVKQQLQEAKKKAEAAARSAKLWEADHRAAKAALNTRTTQLKMTQVCW